MPNRNLAETGKNEFSPLAKSIGLTILMFTMIFSTTHLYAQQRSGPHHHGPAYANQHMSDSVNMYGVKNLAYYGDWDSNRVFIIDIDEMALLETVEGTGDGPYGVDQQDGTKAYALTRKVESLTVIDGYSLENTGEIQLDHKPRSTNFNPETGLSLVSGADKVMTSIIRVDHDKVARVFGYDDDEATPNDYGGSLATGHPLWLDNERFFMLDRVEREIQLWSLKKGLISVLNTPSSVHHIFQGPSKHHNNIYYAVVEGNQKQYLSPSILKFKIRRNKMVVVGEAVLSDYDPTLLNPSEMGSHHATFHPDGEHIYIGSAEGHVFVVNKNSMKVVNMIKTGLGSGHTTFAPMRNLAFVTNHNATFMTVIDTTDHSWKKDIEVASSASSEYKSQSHTSGVSQDMKYFYSAASRDGVFFEIDMETLEVSRWLKIGDDANILMGSFIWDGEGDGM